MIMEATNLTEYFLEFYCIPKDDDFDNLPALEKMHILRCIREIVVPFIDYPNSSSNYLYELMPAEKTFIKESLHHFPQEMNILYDLNEMGPIDIHQEEYQKMSPKKRMLARGYRSIRHFFMEIYAIYHIEHIAEPFYTVLEESLKEECAICWEIGETRENYQCMRCKKSFHKECMEKCQTLACPMCRFQS